MLLETISAFTMTIGCLAKNIYFEARDQPTIGQMAVAEVVMNRVCLLYTSPSPRD